MTDQHENQRNRRNSAPEGGVADLASRAIAELAARRQANTAKLSEGLLGALITGALNRDEAMLQRALDAIINHGIAREDIVDLYVPEAARRLGDAWCSDGLSFAEVTIGSARLQRMVRDYSPRPSEQDAKRRNGSMLVVVRDNEYHTLGAMVAASQLRRSGVSVTLMLCRPDQDVLDAIRSTHYDATLFSVGAAEKVAGFHEFVAKSRDVAKGPMKIGMGGAIGYLGDEALGLAGVDFVSTDAREALKQCDLKTPAKGTARRASKV